MASLLRNGAKFNKFFVHVTSGEMNDFCSKNINLHAGGKLMSSLFSWAWVQ